MIADNKYFVARTTATPRPIVEPFRGKHAVKTNTFFTEIDSLQSKTMPPDWCYKPLKVEVEITDGCNQGCPHCGMDSKPTNSCSNLPGDILRSLPTQLESLGIPGISITGGEPFTAMTSLIELLESCSGKVDVVKLTTNAYWADSMDSSVSLLRHLGNKGLVRARYFRPVLMLSIGEQSVPLTNVVNAILAARRLYDAETLAICISSLSLHRGKDRLSELEDRYMVEVGKQFPWEDVYLTKREYISAGRATGDEGLSRREIPLLEMCKARGCFQQTVGAIVVPTPLVKANCCVFTCSVFGMPDELMLGSLKEASFRELLEVANSAPAVRMLAGGNLPELLASTDREALEQITVSHFHEACWQLIRFMNEKNMGTIRR